MNNCQTFESFRRQEMIVEIRKWQITFSTVKQIACKTIKAYSFFLPYKYFFLVYHGVVASCKTVQETNCLKTELLDTQPQLEESYKIGCVLPSVLPFILPSVCKLSRNWPISFFWNFAVRGPYIVVCDSQIFWKKSPSGKNDQKWPQNKVFGLFKKITSLVLSGICFKWKFLWFINILQKLHAWEKSGSQVIVKCASWPMRFQCSLIVNISLID